MRSLTYLVVPLVLISGCLMHREKEEGTTSADCRVNMERGISVTWKHGELIIGDNEFSGAILDYLTTHSVNGEDALNDSVFWVICRRADGALAEIMGEYIFKGIKSKPGFIERIIDNEDVEEPFCLFMGEQMFWDYYFYRPAEIRKRMASEDVFNEALHDLSQYLSAQEYDYLLELKPELLKWIEAWMTE